MPTFSNNGFTVRYNVTGVTLNTDSSVTGYAGATDRDEVVNGVKRANSWTLTFEVKQANKKSPPTLRVNGFGFPGVDRHPGHVHDKAWKYNVEKTNNSVDRLVLTVPTVTLSNQTFDEGRKEIKVDVALALSAKILLNTH